jgi:hypothetical protein
MGDGCAIVFLINGMSVRNVGTIGAGQHHHNNNKQQTTTTNKSIFQAVQRRNAKVTAQAAAVGGVCHSIHSYLSTVFTAI